MSISSVWVMVSILAYLIFPQPTLAQAKEAGNTKLIFNTQNESITPDGFPVSPNRKVTKRHNLNKNTVLAINSPITNPRMEQPKPKPAVRKAFAGGPVHIDRPNGPVVITPGKEYQVVATAYSSTVDQTDASPFITASGTHVHDGTLAANLLRFGTKVMIPDHYGNKIFIVEDRMRDNHKVDVWFPSRGEAFKFGVKRTRIVVVD